MKKFISMVMTAAMVASLVPATAFAKGGDVTADVKVVKAWTEHRDSSSLPNVIGGDVPEVHMTVKESAQLETAGKKLENEVTLRLDNAKFKGFTATDVVIFDKDGTMVSGLTQGGNPANKYYYEQVSAEAAVKDVLNGGDGTKYGVLADATVTAKNPNTASHITGGTNDLNTKITGLSIPKVQKDTKTQYVEALSAAEKAGKFANNSLGITAGSYFDTANTFSFATNSDGVQVLKNSTDSKVFLIKDLAQFIEGKTPADFPEKLDPQYEQKVVAGIKNLDTATDSIWKETLKVEDTGITPNGAGQRLFVAAPTFNTSGDEVTFVIEGKLRVGDIITINLPSVMDRKTSDAKVRVSGDITVNSSDYMTYVSVQDKSIKASVKKVVKIAVEEHDAIDSDGVTIEGIVAESFRTGSKVVLRLPRGFNFRDDMKLALKDYAGGADVAVDRLHIDDNEAEFYIPSGNVIKDDKMVLRGIEVDVDTAKAGAKATMSIKIDNLSKVEVDIAEVVDYKVVMSVDKDKEVPVYYSMTNAEDKGLTSNDNHESLEVTLEETFPGAWSMRKGFNITLPEGVFVTDVRITNTENFNRTASGNTATKVEATNADWERAFAKAYQDGNHLNFEFEKRVFDDVNTQLEKDPAKLSFILTLVADYDFGGTADKPAEVKLGFDGELVDKQEVVIAKFVKPYIVEAGQNDLKIDARQTKLDKNIVVKEAADGLWDKNTEFVFNVEKDLIKFEDDAKFAVDKDSELAINDHSKRDRLSYDVKTVGNKKGTVTISDIALFMERNIPQGEYALELTGTLRDALHQQVLFAPDHLSPAEAFDDAKVRALKFGDKDLKGDNFVDDVARDKDEVVSKKFINVITARRDEDGFTTRVAVPVGEAFIFAGADKLEGAENSMEVPAYINKDNYTMLPLRAVARALGIANGNIYWSQDKQTATVQYGNSRIMTFKLGAKEMIINGHSMPAVAGIEMTNNRLFLSLRDLGVAMNVPAEKIAWDSKTRTAYLNPTEEDMAAING